MDPLIIIPAFVAGACASIKSHAEILCNKVSVLI